MIEEAILQMYRETHGVNTRRYFGISSISPCPTETYYNYQAFIARQAGRGTQGAEGRSVNPQLQLLMDDGHYQEAQIVDLLRRCSFPVTHTGKDQVEVYIGRAHIPGHPDGFVSIGEKWHMLEVKARSQSTFQKFVSTGLDAFPRIRTQVQLYLNSDGLPHPVEDALVTFKHKESVRIKDVTERRNRDFGQKVTEETDRIILDGWEPPPVQSPLCAGCDYATRCWGTPVLDFSGFHYNPLPELTEKYIQGDAYEDLGKGMKKEAREALVQELGEYQELQTEGLRVTRSDTVRRSLNTDRLKEALGEDGYNQYCDFVPVTTVRVNIL